MSYHWENVVWQSKDGSWSRGFFHRISRSDSPNSWGDEDYDSEWDDDFDFDSFDHVRTGFPTAKAAQSWQPGANPGGCDEIPYAGNSKESKGLDQLAHWFKYPEEKKKHDRKELLRKNREHFKALAVEWSPEAMRRSLADRFDTLQVSLKGDERAFDRLGFQTIVTGGLVQDGDWLKIEGKRIYNLKTDKFEKHVHKLERYRPVSRPGYRRW